MKDRERAKRTTRPNSSRHLLQGMMFGAGDKRPGRHGPLTQRAHNYNLTREKPGV